MKSTRVQKKKDFRHNRKNRGSPDGRLWQDAGAKDVRPAVEPLEQRILLDAAITTTQKDLILAGMTQLASVSDYFDSNSALGTSVSILSNDMGSAFGLDAVFTQDVITATNSYFGSGSSWTLEGWAAYLQSHTVYSTIGITSYYTSDADLRYFTFSINSDRHLTTWNVDVATPAEDIGLDELGLTISDTLAIDVDAIFSGSITLGVDTTNGFFISASSLSLVMDLTSSDTVDMSMGLFTLQNSSVTADGVGISISLVDPNSSGRIYTSELAAYTSSIVSSSWSDTSASVQLPLQFKSIAGFTISDFASPTILTLSTSNLVSSSTLAMSTTRIGQLIQATAISAESLSDGFLQLATYLGGAQGLAVMQTDIPFTTSQINDIVNIADAISDGLVSNVVTVDGDGVATPLFSTLSELASVLTGLTASGETIVYNPTTREMTIHFDYDYDFDAVSVTMDLSAGADGLELSTSSTLSLDGSLALDFTLGVQVASQSEQLTVLPVGQDAATEDSEAGILNGQLSSNAVFVIRVDDDSEVTVTVTSGSTSSNTNLLDLVADINSALASAGLSSSVEAFLVNYTYVGGDVDSADFSDGSYDHTGLIGFRTKSGTSHYSLRVEVTAGNIANTQLGYPASMSAKQDLLSFFVEDASIAASITLSGAAAATAELGIVSLTLSGSASVTATVTGSLVDPTDSGTRITYAEFVTLTASKSWPDMLELTYDGSGYVLFDSVSVGSVGGLSLGADPQIQISFAHITDPMVFTVTKSDLGNLTSLENLSVSDILDFLAEGATVLSQMEELSFLQYELPIINVNVADLLDIAAQWTATIEDAQAASQEGQSYQLFAAALDDLLGAKGFTCSLSLDGTSLKFTLTYTYTISEDIPFNFSLNSLMDLVDGSTDLFDELSSLFDANGTAIVTVGGQVTASISLGLDLSDTDNPRVFIYDDSTVSLGVRAVASDLDFNFSFGPLSIYVKDGSAALDADGDADTVDYATFAITITDGDSNGRHYLDDDAEPISADLACVVTAAAGVSLPVYYPSESIPLGGTGNNILSISIDDLQDLMENVAGSVSITAPDFNNLLDGLNIIEVIADPVAVLDGLKSQFDMVTESLSEVLAAVDLPLVGDQLVSVVDFIQDLADDVLGYVRTTLNNALDGQTPTELLQLALYSALHDYLQDANGDGQITIDDVVMDIDSVDYQNIEYRLELGGTLLSAMIDFGGLDLLALEIDGQIQADLTWSWDFGFGVNVTDGFYVVTTYDPEISLNLDVTIPEDLEGDLYFFDLVLTSMSDDGSTVQRDRSVLSGAFYVNLSDPNDDGRLTLAEMRSSSISDLVSAGFTGGLSADFCLTLSLGGSDVFPQFRVIISMDWDWNRTFGEAAVVTPLEIDFTSVQINLGSVINGFLKPILEQIDEILDPIRPVLDFLTEELPIVNASLLDIASAFGYGSYADFIEAVDWVADLAASVSSISGDDFWLDMGSFTLTGNSGSSEGSIGDTTTPDFEANLNSSSADASTKSFLTEAVSGNSYFVINILQPSTIFNLLMGEDVALFTFAIPDLEISASYSQFFSVFGPLGMRITGDLSVKFHISFGYDTYGIRMASETGNWAYIFDGFYVTTRENADGTGAVVPTVTFSLGLTAAAELNLGIASGGVSGGIYGQMDLTLVDPNDDGKIRLTELWYAIQDPTNLFDIDIIVTASVKWYIKVGWGVFSWSTGGTIWSGTIYSDSWTATRTEVLASEGTNDQIVLNVGSYAENRLYNATDGDDTVSVSASGSTLTVTINGVSQDIAYEPGVTTLLIDGGDGDDTITIDSSVNANVEITGGAGNDVITVNGNGDATIDGGDGNDTIYYYGSGTAVLRGGNGADTLRGGSGTNTLEGGAGNDTLIGGTGSNTFVFDDGFGSDAISSLGVTNIMDFTQVAAALTLSLTAKTVTDASGNLATMSFTPTLVKGGSGSDTILGRNEVNVWTITGGDEGTYNSQVGFESFERLIGSSTYKDTFIFSDGAYVSDYIDGGVGSEQDSDATYAEQIAGDELDFSAYTTSTRFDVLAVGGGRLYVYSANPAFTNIENITAGVANDYLVFNDDAYIVGIFDGNTGEDRIDLSDYRLVDYYKVNIVDITGYNSGGINERTAFTGVESFNGGTNEDIYYFYAAATTPYADGFLHAPSGSGGALTGSIDSKGNSNNTISDSPTYRESSMLTSEVAEVTASLLTEETSIETDLLSSEGTTYNGIVADDYDVIWDITGTNSGTRTENGTTVTFTNTQNLEGSTLRDLFIIHVGGSLDGYINGAGGDDTLIYGWTDGDWSSNVSVNFQTITQSVASGVAGYVENVELYVAGTGTSNSFLGTDITSNWVITGYNSGGISGATPMSFINFHNITAGIGAETFTFTLATSSGDDTMDFTGCTMPGTWTITDAGDGSVQIIGESSVITIAFSSIENLLLTDADDTISFDNNDAFLDSLDGGAGDDELDLSARSVAVTIDLEAMSMEPIGLFAGFESIIGTGSADFDTLVGADQVNAFAITGVDSGTVNGALAFESIENLVGGSNDDTFTFSGAGELSGDVDGGGAGSSGNTLSFSGVTGSVSVNLESDTADRVGGTFSNILNFVGGTNGGELTGPDGQTNAWHVTGAGSGYLNTHEANFTDFSDITGGTGNDTLIMSAGASLTGTFDGVSGTDTLDYTSFGDVTLDVEQQSVTGTGGYDNVDVFNATATNTTVLIGPNDTNTWLITQNSGGTLNGVLTFTGVLNLVGGTGDDTFRFSDGRQILGAIDGGDGTDLLDYSLQTTAIAVNLQTSTASLTGGFSNIEQLTGSALTTDMLTAANVANDWTITGANAGGINSEFEFTAIEDLVGGSDDDSFAMQTGGSISGSIDGAAGANTLDYSSRSVGVEVDLKNATATNVAAWDDIQTFIGSADTDDILKGTDADATWALTSLTDGSIDAPAVDFEGFEDLRGGAGVNTLQGPELDLTWNLLAANAGNINGSTAFSGMANLVSNLGSDTLVISDGASLSGSFDGGTGDDGLDYSAYTSDVTVDLENKTATAIGDGWTSVKSFIGGSGSNELIGPNADTLWTIIGEDGGNLNAGEIEFASFGNLTGGGGKDSFALNVDGTITGLLDGGDDLDNLDYGAYTVSVTVNLENQTASGIGGGWVNLETFIGSSSDNELIGFDSDTTWNITGANAGNVDEEINFELFGNLTGGSGDDEFIMSAATELYGLLDGGDGDDRLDYSAYTTGVTVNMEGQTATDLGDGWANIETFIGGSGSNEFVGPDADTTWALFDVDTGDVAVTTRFQAFGNITGGSGDDEFVMSDSATLSGMIDGGAGDNTLDYSADTVDVTVNLEDQTATGMAGGWANIATFIGGSGDNELIGPDAATTWNITGADAGNVDGTTNFTAFGNLTGGSDDDVFVMSNGVTLSGMIDGGDGDDTLDYSAYTTAMAVNLQAGTATGLTDGWADIETFIGGSGSNQLTGFNATSTWNITGNNAGNIVREYLLAGGLGAPIPSTVYFVAFGTLVGGTGADTFVFTDGKVLSVGLDGGAGQDYLDFSAYKTYNTWTQLDDTTYQIETLFGTFTYTGIEMYEGGTSVILFPNVDLQATLGTVTATNELTLGQKFQVQVIVTNIGNSKINKAVTISVYASADGTVESGVLLGTLTKTITLSKNQAGTYTVTVTVPTDMEFGDYQLVAFVDSGNVLSESDKTNNIVASGDTWEVLGLFGKTSTGQTIKLSLETGDGGTITFSLTGGGYGYVTTGVGTYSIELFSTGLSSKCTITVTNQAGTEVLEDVVVHNALGSFIALGCDLLGDVTIDGPLASLSMHDLIGEDTHIVQINAGTGNAATTITLNTVTDLQLTTQYSIKQFTATSWTDTDGEADSLTAVSVSKLTILGQMVAGITTTGNLSYLAISGDLSSTVQIGGSLVSAIFGGELTGTIDVTGNAGMIRLTTGNLSGGVIVGGSLATLQLDAGSLSGTLNVTGDAKTIKVQNAISGDVTIGGVLGVLQVNTGDLGGDLNVTGDAKTIKVQGAVSGDVTIGGMLGVLQVNTGDLGGVLNVTGDAKTIKVQGALSNDVIIGGSLTGLLMVNGTFTGDVAVGGLLNVLVANAGLTSTISIGDALKKMTVVGDMSGVISAGGTISSYSQSNGDLSGRLRSEASLSNFNLRNGDLTGQVYAVDRIGSATITGGDLTGRIGTNGYVNKLYIKSVGGVGGAILGGKVEAGDTIGTLSTAAASTGTISAAMMNNIVLRGGFDGDIISVGTVTSYPALARRANILSLSVIGGDLDGTISSGSIKTLKVSGGDFLAEADITGNLSAFSLTSVRGVGGSMADGATLDVGGNLGKMYIGSDYGADTVIDGSLAKYTIKGETLAGASLTVGGVAVI